MGRNGWWLKLMERWARGGPTRGSGTVGDGTGTASPEPAANPNRGPQGAARPVPTRSDHPGERKAGSYLSCGSTGAPSGTGAAAMVLRGEAGAGGERRGRRCRGDPRDL